MKMTAQHINTPGYRKGNFKEIHINQCLLMKSFQCLNELWINASQAPDKQHKLHSQIAGGKKVKIRKKQKT